VTTNDIRIKGQTYSKDSQTNATYTILNKVDRNLHLKQNHPIYITRKIIEQSFPKKLYTLYNNLSPIVTVEQNFDSLGFAQDHVGRDKSDTYYINKDVLLRTHTSAHQAEKFRETKTQGYLISADVYRRDAIDRSHYPVFHQMEGARMWSRNDYGDELAKVIQAEVDAMPPHPANIHISDPNPPFHDARNPVQSDAGHSEAEVVAMGNHLKRTLETVFVDIFTRARQAAKQAGVEMADTNDDSKIEIRWVEAFFPFTTPSWELEVAWQGEWLEVLGCGIVKQHLPNNAGVPDKIGWAFGLGLERIAMLLFGIPDIRLFWSEDERFLDQFKSGQVVRFAPFSKYPATVRDVSFWLPKSHSTGEDVPLHENDFTEIVRDVAGDIAESVVLVSLKFL